MGTGAWFQTRWTGIAGTLINYFGRIDPRDLPARGMAKSGIMELAEERHEDVATISKSL
jgi:hypothetical protein